jgi:rhodanese-related sulfurtransferase
LSLAVTIKLIEKSGALSAALLRNRGFLVRRLEGGFPEWKAAGLATGSSKLNAA